MPPSPPQHRILFSEPIIAGRIEQLARVIGGDLPSGFAPVVIGLLTGSFVFVADLVRALARGGVQPQVDFLGVGHYGEATQSSGMVTVYKNLRVDVRGRPVLLVDDIADSGLSLHAARAHVLAQHPLWLRTCVLLNKPARRTAEVATDYVGFEVPDVWLIGYGLDAGGQGRALPYIAILESDQSTT
ncbi:MAG: hypoxanthine phosphoribosyltransferase [Deltaproteobacteria bacterium]|nr:hypoxanthine phosphoribosyltransferase [Deltaproteobacteria bacterium]